MIALRSLLFSPGSSRAMLEKAKRSGADALIFDLEDAVSASRLGEARANVAAALAGPDLPPVFVRVNHPSTGEMDADLDAAVAASCYGVVLPKAETADEIVRLDAALSRREEQRGLRRGAIVVLPLIESGRGLHFAYEIATASARVVGLAFSSGEAGDFMADIEGRWTPDGLAMLYPRSKTVCDTRAAGLTWPVDGVVMNLADDDALERECRLARTLGFQAKMAIHPGQLATIHRIFSPSPDEVTYSLGLIAAYHEAAAGGQGAFRYQGMMVDKANIVGAQRTLARAARAPR